MSFYKSLGVIDQRLCGLNARENCWFRSWSYKVLGCKPLASRVLRSAMTVSIWKRAWALSENWAEGTPYLNRRRSWPESWHTDLQVSKQAYGVSCALLENESYFQATWQLAIIRITVSGYSYNTTGIQLGRAHVRTHTHAEPHIYQASTLALSYICSPLNKICQFFKDRFSLCSPGWPVSIF